MKQMSNTMQKRPATAESFAMRQSRGGMKSATSKAGLRGMQKAYETDMLTNLDVKTNQDVTNAD